MTKETEDLAKDISLKFELSICEKIAANGEQSVAVKAINACTQLRKAEAKANLFSVSQAEDIIEILTDAFDDNCDQFDRESYVAEAKTFIGIKGTQQRSSLDDLYRLRDLIETCEDETIKVSLCKSSVSVFKSVLANEDSGLWFFQHQIESLLRWCVRESRRFTAYEGEEHEDAWIEIMEAAQEQYLPNFREE